MTEDILDRADDLPQTARRPSVMVAVAIDQAASHARQAAIEVRRFTADDPHAPLFDRLHACAQISDDQHAAAARVATLWLAASVGTRVTARYGESVPRGDEADDDVETARDRWRRLMRALRPVAGDMVLDVLQDRYPGVCRLATLRAALDDVGAWFEREEKR